jgi:hypothetical protein
VLAAKLRSGGVHLGRREDAIRSMVRGGLGRRLGGAVFVVHVMPGVRVLVLMPFLRKDGVCQSQRHESEEGCALHVADRRSGRTDTTRNIPACMW